MKIVQIIPSLDPRYGGPSVSVPNLAAGLAAVGHDVQLFSTGPAVSLPATHARLQVEFFAPGWPAAICASPSLQARLNVCGADLYHSHGLWLRPLHYANRAARRNRKPHIISPRGMMSGWAWRHRAWRKKLVRAFVHPRAFESAAGWHATSTEEADDIRALGFKQPICVAPNGTAAPTATEIAEARTYWRETCPDVARRPTAVFYSRFHRKKRVLELIDLWLEHAPSDWVLLMVGLADDYTSSQLETYIMRSSGSGRIHVFEGDGRPPPYAVASVFLLPSWNENFGLAIAEAMAHGLPVVVTDSTPWSGVNAICAGWCVPWEQFAPTVLVALAEGPAALAARGEIARRYVLTDFSWEKSAARLDAFYREISGAKSSP